jgi:hypothetical protein
MEPQQRLPAAQHAELYGAQHSAPAPQHATSSPALQHVDDELQHMPIPVPPEEQHVSPLALAQQKAADEAPAPPAPQQLSVTASHTAAPS